MEHFIVSNQHSRVHSAEAQVGVVRPLVQGIDGVPELTDRLAHSRDTYLHVRICMSTDAGRTRTHFEYAENTQSVK